MVDIQPTTQSISDDQELAKVLAGVSQDGENTMQYEETQNAQAGQPATGPAAPVDQPQTGPVPEPAPQVDQTQPEPATDPRAQADNELTPIKDEAINELRPLVDKLELPPEEKFDAYLLLIRSTDDKSLIAPAHAAARTIDDETKRAQALLDIIKEIDYLSSPPQA